ncbi:alpha/beta fold hydrolase [Kitasatospora arboriphila]
MAEVRAGDVLLHYEETGEGEPLVLVHGSWNDHRSWRPAVDADLKAAFRVVAYDRRGHGRSERVPGAGTRRQDEDDLAALIEALGPAPANVAANSFGASITAGLAARRPELFRRIVLHEPPLAGLVLDDPAAVADMRTVTAAVEEAKRLVREGEDAARREGVRRADRARPRRLGDDARAAPGHLRHPRADLARRTGRPGLGRPGRPRTRCLHGAGAAQQRHREPGVVRRRAGPPGRGPASGTAQHLPGRGPHPPCDAPPGLRGDRDGVPARNLTPKAPSAAPTGHAFRYRVAPCPSRCRGVTQGS